MSLKSMLMPTVTERLLGRKRLLKKRAKAERIRVAKGTRHTLHYFHQVDDPYSALTATGLEALVERYDVELHAHIVGPPPDAAAPERGKLVAHSRRDSELLARHYGLSFRDPGVQPDRALVGQTTALLVQAAIDGRVGELAPGLSERLWQQGEGGLQEPPLAEGRLSAATDREVEGHLRESAALRERLGHYLGATFFYAGEWYWGLDRLYHLEQRLQDVGAQRAGAQDYLFPPPIESPKCEAQQGGPRVDFFFSLRSPYSAIAAPRVFEIGRVTGAAIRLRYVLPMVMRGLPVPRTKRMYIVEDTAREAHVRGVPFGRLNDPLGKPTERGLSLMPLAEQHGCGEAYVLSFMRGVWAEGLDAGSDAGLRTIAERAGLDWGDARRALRDEGWRGTAERNRQEMGRLGVWGVPSFRVGERVFWGQDRLWAVHRAILDASGSVESDESGDLP